MDNSHRLQEGVPVFFLSYAHPRPSSNLGVDQPVDGRGYVQKFFWDLFRDVREIVGSRAESGLMDYSMPGGSQWSPLLLDILRTVQVFVALVCTDYVHSEWCAMEWDAFSRRKVRVRPGAARSQVLRQRQSGILPVIWAPMDPSAVPGAIEAVQRFGPGRFRDAGLWETYEENGIYGLLRVKSPDYEAVVWHLAKRVAELMSTIEVEPGEVLTVKELSKVFGGEAE